MHWSAEFMKHVLPRLDRPHRPRRSTFTAADADVDDERPLLELWLRVVMYRVDAYDGGCGEDDVGNAGASYHVNTID